MEKRGAPALSVSQPPGSAPAYRVLVYSLSIFLTTSTISAT